MTTPVVGVGRSVHRQADPYPSLSAVAAVPVRTTAVQHSRMGRYYYLDI